MKLEYPVFLEKDSDGSFIVDFVDFPNVHTYGSDEQEALIQAVDALESAFDFYFEDRIPIPAPSRPTKGQKTVEVPPLVAIKVQLWNEMHVQKLRKSDLARSLNVRMQQIDRLFSTRHTSRLEMIENAARALGKTISIELA